jgi:hypothetical protein
MHDGGPHECAGVFDRRPRSEGRWSRVTLAYRESASHWQSMPLQAPSTLAKARIAGVGHVCSPLLRVTASRTFRSFVCTADKVSRGMVGQVEDGGLQAKDVAISPKAHDLTDGHAGEVGMLPKSFAASQIGEMHFDGRNLDGGDGISQRHTGVGIGTGIDDQRIDAPHRPLNGIDKASFMVGLQDFELDMVLSSKLLQAMVDVLKGDNPIHLGFSAAEQVQVRTM